MNSIDRSENWKKISEYHLYDEISCVEELIELATFTPTENQKIADYARVLVESNRKKNKLKGRLEAFNSEYNLSSEEGVTLMCLAEALIRIPDNLTADRLIRSKLSIAEFETHLGKSASLFVNASTWGLVLTGKLTQVNNKQNYREIFSGLVSRMGEPLIRVTLKEGMKLMASQYVMGNNIELALKRSKNDFKESARFSFDMLGESALSMDDAKRYYQAYENAITEISNSIDGEEGVVDFALPGISIKLSALHPRYEYSQKNRVFSELLPTLVKLVKLAKEKNVSVTLDAEEADRLELSLQLFEQLLSHKDISGWNGVGLAVQAYQKRAYPVLCWLRQLARSHGIKIPVRLVKGAYWDTEIKHAQTLGLTEYPVFTKKSHTDISYIACASYLFSQSEYFYPQMATHNAHTIAVVKHLADQFGCKFEFQRLHGMGEQLYDAVLDVDPCRIYSPVGRYQDLLPYLVRRLLENGANTSFVNRMEDESISVETIVQHPASVALCDDEQIKHGVVLPENLYDNRRNSKGWLLANQDQRDLLLNSIARFKNTCWFEEEKGSNSYSVFSPANSSHLVGVGNEVSDEAIVNMLNDLSSNVNKWKNTSVEFRVAIIKKFASRLQQHAEELYAMCIYEAGKTLRDAVDEIREAIDFCEYYVSEALRLFDQPIELKGPVGESNQLIYRGRGMFVCISPWNFPVAIFVGQIIAALLSGNTVAAKPSSKTRLVAKRIVQLLYKSGLPNNAFSLLDCRSELISNIVLKDSRVSGVAFTGSFHTARKINQTLANRHSPIVPVIAETGGLNVMIVDSSAMPEQVVTDIISSAFLSAGQRCSALRVLIVQDDVRERIFTLLIQAMEELVIGDPAIMSTDIPPVIDRKAKDELDDYKQQFKDSGTLLYECETPSSLAQSNFVSPAVVEIKSLSQINEEKFGPILHVLNFKASGIEKLMSEINDMGFGLTLGVHSRVNETINKISTLANVGNIYINRNMVGATVGVQPFGGEGYSGTGPKAGGPNYLQRFCVEKTITTNTAAVGGNVALLLEQAD